MTSICIIEDDPQYRLAMEHVLKLSARFSPTGTWESAESALASLHHLKSLPDIALVDIHLPGMNGISFIRMLRKEYPNILCVVLSIFEDDTNVFEALKAGASGYLLKDDGPEIILKGIKELLEGGAPMSWKIARKVIHYFHHTSTSNNLNQLTPREREVLALLSTGKLYKEVSDKLGISITTTKQHIKNIYSKLEVRNKMEAINKWRLF